MRSLLLVPFLVLFVTAPDNAVFDPLNNRWVAENEAVPPDIEVHVDARSAAIPESLQTARGVSP